MSPHLETIVEEEVDGTGGWKRFVGIIQTQRIRHLRIPLRTPLRALDLMVEATDDGVNDESKPSK